MKISRSLILLSVTFATFAIFSGCEDSSTGTNNGTNIKEDSTYLIDPGLLIRGASTDGIASIDDPQFTSINNIGFMNDGDLLAVVKIDGEVRAYPYRIMDYHEIVNDRVNNTSFAFTYCPLTGTAICWNREIEGDVTEFGVSGLLYNNNLIPYDRKTQSLWSQMQTRSIAEERAGTQLENFDVVETSWKTFKAIYPDAKVLSSQTGYNFGYGSSQRLYGDYRNDNNRILFDLTFLDDRLPAKKLVHGIIGEDSHLAIPVGDFGSQVRVVEDEVKGEPVIIAGTANQHLVTSFYNDFNGNQLTFTPVQGELPVIMEDNLGNRWNVFGEAVSGPNQGAQLEPTESYNAFWFAWGAFWNNTEIRRLN